MVRRETTEEELPRRIRAVGYTRVSTEDQLDGRSLHDQAKVIDRRCTKKDWDLLEIYEEKGRSAWRENFNKRPEFNRMMEDAEAGKFDFLIVASSDRIGRNSAGAMALANQLMGLGIWLVSIQDPIDLTNPSGKAQYGIAAIFNEFNSDITSQKVKRAVKEKRAEGLAWGRGPYGYQMCGESCPRDDDHKYWHLNSEKAPAVAKMFELYDSGTYSTANIAAWLDDEGYKTNGQSVDMPGAQIKGNIFTTHSVSGILKNRAYIGMIKDPESEDGYRFGQHTPIVDKDLFERVQLRLSKNAGTRENAGTTTKEPTVLARIVRCYMCFSLYQCVRNSARGYVFLRVKRRPTSPECICVGKSFTSRHIERDMNTLLQGFSLPEDWQAKIMESLRHDPDAEEIEKERKSIRKLMLNNDSLFAYGRIDKSTFLTRLAQFENDLASLQLPKKGQIVDAGQFLVKKLGPLWSDATTKEKNEILHRIFAAIYVDIETRRIHSLVPKEEFTILVRAMAERGDVKLEELPQGRRPLEEKGGFSYQWSTNPLKPVFTHELLLAELTEQIRDRRYEWGMSRVQLAERLGVSASAIASWEQGSTPPMGMFEVLSEWLAEEPPAWAVKETDIPSLGGRIKEHREAWGLTQDELGERIGVSPAAIGSCERGSTPSMQTISKLASWLAEKAPVRQVKQSIDKAFGKRIQKKRLMLGMSRTALSKQLGVDRKQVSRWEEGLSAPSKANLEMMTEWLSESDDYTLAQRLRDKRKMLGITQKDIAELFGVSLIAIKTWEQGRRIPSHDNFQRVLTWLSRDHLKNNSEEQPEFARFVLPMKEKRENLGIGTLTLAHQLGVGKNQVSQWEAGRSVPSQEGCNKIFNWLQAA